MLSSVFYNAMSLGAGSLVVVVVVVIRGRFMNVLGALNKLIRMVAPKCVICSRLYFVSVGRRE